MAGVKGRSGRKSNYHEAKEGDLLKLCTEWIINNFDSFDKDTKVRVALDIAKRGIADKHEHSGTIFIDLAEKLEDARNRRLNLYGNAIGV